MRGARDSWAVPIPVRLLVATCAAGLHSGCEGPVEPQLRVEIGEGTLGVHANVPLLSVRLLDSGGIPWANARPNTAATDVVVVVPPGTEGLFTVEAAFDGGIISKSLTLEGANDRMWVEVQAPIGAPPAPVQMGDTLSLAVIDETAVPILVRVKLPRASSVDFAVNGAVVATARGAAGERVSGSFSLIEDSHIEVRTATEDLAFNLDAIPTPVTDLTGRLSVKELRFPANPNGSADLVRPRGRVTIPSDWWRSILSRLGLGTRIHDPTAPWAYLGVVLENRGESLVDLVVRSRILDRNGVADTSFRPRMREGDDGTGNTSVMVRVPGKSTIVATIPVYVDEEQLGLGPWRQQVELFPVGAATAAISFDQPLYQSRGSSILSAGLSLALVGSVSGMAFIALRLRRWLANFDTRTLVTIALFASLSFVVGTSAQLVGLGIASAAGPFSSMIVGLLDDAFTVTLMSTLLAFAPRPGVVALSTLVAWLLRGVALGALSPLDIVFVACRVAFYESALWVFGLTRSGAWRDEPTWKRRFRLAAGFGTASLFTAAASMVFHAVLYRLFFAEWYVAMMLAGPGFLYAILGTIIGDRVATALRRVED